MPTDYSKFASIYAIDERLERLQADMAKIVGREQGGATLTRSEENRFDAIKKEITECRDRRAVLVHSADRLERAAKDGTREPGDISEAPKKGRLQHLRRVDVSDEDAEMRDRGLSRLDQLVSGEDDYALADDDAERTENLIRGPGDAGELDAELIVRGSNKAYSSAFRKYLKGQAQTFHFGFTRDEQDAWAATQQFLERASLNTTTGAALIPTQLDPTINLTNVGAINAVRKLARVETLALGSAYHAVTSAGASGEWLTSQLSEVTDATPSFSTVTITPQSADVYISASWEAVMDVGTNGAGGFDSQLMRIFQDAKDRLEADAFTGTGSTSLANFTGSITQLGATTASRVSATTNASFGAVDIFKTFRALPARYQPNAKWLTNYAFEADIRQFATGSGPQSAFWADMSSPLPAQLIGRPFFGCTGMTSSLSVATASSDLILALADWSQLYLIADRQGATVSRSDWVVGSSGRPTLSSGFLFWWRTAAGVLNVDAGRVLVV